MHHLCYRSLRCRSMAALDTDTSLTQLISIATSECKNINVCCSQDYLQTVGIPKNCLGESFCFAIFKSCYAHGLLHSRMNFEDIPLARNTPPQKNPTETKVMLPLILLVMEHSPLISPCKYFELNPQVVQVVCTPQRSSVSVCQCSCGCQRELFILSIHKCKPVANEPVWNVFVNID